MRISKASNVMILTMPTLPLPSSPGSATLRRFVALSLLLLSLSLQAQTTKDLPYSTEKSDPLRTLDIYAPKDAKNLPVLFWIHGGGWQAGDKTDVKLKPQYFTNQGLLFVSINYRLQPKVDMETLTRDVADAFAFVHKNIASHGGDPSRILVGGHSAGAQLAALLCTDDRYLKAHNIPFTVLKGCIPVDGDTYDIPAIIEVAETRARAHQTPLPRNGHRQKFGNDPDKHIAFSTITHIGPNKHIPPFLILYVSGHPDTSAQANRLNTILKQNKVPSTLFGGRETTHNKLNDDLGLPNDPATKALTDFLVQTVKPL